MLVFSLDSKYASWQYKQKKKNNNNKKTFKRHPPNDVKLFVPLFLSFILYFIAQIRKT